MNINDNYTMLVLKKSCKELIYKIITAIFIRGLLLVIPIFWSKIVNNINNGSNREVFSLIVIIIILSIFYYIWQYLNQLSWFYFYDKLSLEYTSLITKNNISNIKKVTFGEYTNVINNDIDILCNFLGNGVGRVVQIIEIFFIYFYFLSLDIYIFLISLLVSFIMVLLLIISGKSIKEENIKRKSALDKKIVVSQEMYESLRDGVYDEGMFKKFYNSHINYLKSNKRFNLLSMAIIYLVLGIIEISKYGIIIYCIYLIFHNMMEVGSIILIFTYFDKIIANFEVIGTISAEYQSFIVSLKRLNKLGDS